MRSTQYPEDIILNLLKEAASGTPIGQVCSTACISMRTFYRWRAQYGGLTLAAARERNDLLRENARLRALLRDARHRHEPRRRVEEACRVIDRTSLPPIRSEFGTGSPPNARGGCSTGRFASVRGRT